MNNENIKILRSKISIPLNKAVELLKKNNGDVTLSEQDFHDENILEISKMANCDQETARKEYQICNYDVIKTMKKINDKPVKIGIGKFPDSKIGFILWPENAKGEFYKTAKRNDVFIQTEDFDIVLEKFQSVFPLKKSSNNAVENEFDALGHNFFDNETSRDIVEKISLIETDDQNVKVFLGEIISWLNDKLVYADYIVVYGNL